ncbi:MAG: sugar phosphate isomerase/epimerase [Planctomycetales bacterium]|nr:sugar phosphate isomerase/epimerase [Planctomycetales bacterium]
MLDIKVAIQPRAMRLPLKQALPVVAQLGVGAVELDGRHDLPSGDVGRTAIRALRKMLDDFRLSVVAVNFASRRGFHVLEGLEARVDALKSTMRLAHSLGAPVVPFSVGYIPTDDELPTARSTLVDVLADLGRFGQHVGALPAADTGGQSQEVVADLLDALPAHSIGLVLNPAALTGAGRVAHEAARRWGDAVYHVYANDAQFDPAARRGEQTVLGRGTVDYPALLGALEERGYRGHFTIAGVGADDAVDETRDAIKYLRSFA